MMGDRLINSPCPGIRYGFVVLNYNNYRDTIACVNSILRIENRSDYYVVIVDNASPNNSFPVLNQEFKGRQRIALRLSEENKGYSGGNNVGIRVLLQMGIDRIIIATNDTEILSPDILDQFDKIKSDNVGIVGGDVLTLEGVHQNPPLYRPTFLYFLNLYLYEPMAWIRGVIYKCMPLIARMRRASVKENMENLGGHSIPANECPVYMLHGCFLYLTKSYLNKNGLLDEHLFMYGEEDLMSWNCERHGLKRLYLPSVKILHKDARSTKDIHKEDRDLFVRATTKKSKRYLRQQIGWWALMGVVLRGLLW